MKEARTNGTQTSMAMKQSLLLTVNHKRSSQGEVSGSGKSVLGFLGWLDDQAGNMTTFRAMTDSTASRKGLVVSRASLRLAA